ncbi:unnamed protein product [Brassica oleracea var. botrytis]
MEENLQAGSYRRCFGVALLGDERRRCDVSEALRIECVEEKENTCMISIQPYLFLLFRALN